ncbi:helix-turn-helix protein [compost metagenome]
MTRGADTPRCSQVFREQARSYRVSRQTINAIENGRYDPSLPLAFQIARTFSLPIESIFDDEFTG